MDRSGWRDPAGIHQFNCRLSAALSPFPPPISPFRRPFCTPPWFAAADRCCGTSGAWGRRPRPYLQQVASVFYLGFQRGGKLTRWNNPLNKELDSFQWRFRRTAINSWWKMETFSRRQLPWTNSRWSPLSFLFEGTQRWTGLASFWCKALSLGAGSDGKSSSEAKGRQLHTSSGQLIMSRIDLWENGPHFVVFLCFVCSQQLRGNAAFKGQTNKAAPTFGPRPLSALNPSVNSKVSWQILSWNLLTKTHWPLEDVSSVRKMHIE